MLPAVAAHPTHGHSCARPSFEHCSQQQLYLPMDIQVFPLNVACSDNSPLLNVAPNNRPICQWTFMPYRPMDIHFRSQ
jgi:hypothetical protein